MAPAPQRSSGVAAAAAAAAAFAAMAAERAAQPRDNLQLIDGLNATFEAKLRECGVFTHQAIAAWTEYDIARVSQHLCIQRGVFAQMQWREKAQQLIQPESANHAQMALRRRGSN